TPEKFKKVSGNPMPLDKAMDITNNWREAVKGLFGDDDNKIPRAFYIPIGDMEALVDNYKKYKLSGVRAYFVLSNPQPPYTDEMRGILVPVTEEIGDDGKPYYKDLIIKAADPAAKHDDMSIYDLTRPCPVFCDKASPLY
ncbi:MAG: hypothetical protein ABW019_16920, partial [Chitinophagaceae bacterium]